MATYVNDLRLTELATGEGSGTWGVTTNTNLELIGEALGYGTQNCFASDADSTTTVADGASDPARSFYFKVTSSATLTATRVLTIAPNTVSRVMFIENATTGSQSIAISQGSGANVTIATGKTAVVYLDGAGSGAAVVDAMALVDPGVTDTLAEVLTAGNTSSGTNIELTTTDKVQFRDSAIYINSSADGQLDIVADTEVQIATTTVDLNGALDVSGAITGTTATLTTADNTTQLTLKSTDTDASVGPVLDLHRDSSSPADNDYVGEIRFRAENDASEIINYAGLASRIIDVTDGTEDGRFELYTSLNGAQISRVLADATETVINQDSADLDFRVESNNNANMLFVDAGNDAIGIGNSNPGGYSGDGRDLVIGTTSGDNGLSIISGTSGTGNIYFGDVEETGTGSRRGQIVYDHATDHMRFATAATEAMRIDSSGLVDIGSNATASAGSSKQLLSLVNPSGTTSTAARLWMSGTNATSRGTYIEAEVQSTGNDHDLIFATSASGSAPSEAMRIDSSGHLIVPEGITLGTSVGTYAAANTLDDYEEGDYDATITTGTSGTVTLNGSYNRLSYTKVGRSVHVSGFLVVSSVSSPVGYFKINLPFTPANLTDRAGDSAVALWLNNVASANIADFIGSINEGSANLFVQLGDGVSVQDDSAQQLQANSYIIISATYNAA